MVIEREDLLCPWRDFNSCLRMQCPFYGKIRDQRVVICGGADYRWETVLGCTRAQSKIKEETE